MLKINKILYPTDFSNCSKQAFPHALFLARKYSAEFHMLHVVTVRLSDVDELELEPSHLEEYNASLEKHAKVESDKLIREHKEIANRIINIQKRGNSPSAVILQYAYKNDMDLIVMGTHGRRGLGYLFLGSVAEEVTRFARRPVYSIREQKLITSVENINRILVPVDFSEYSKQALQYANELCKMYLAELEIMHVIEDKIHPALYATGKSSIFDIIPDIKEKSSALIQEMFDEISGEKVKFSLRIVKGIPAQEILEHVENNKVDLIVLPTHGTSGLDRFLLGSVAEKIIRRSICPVFIIKSFGKQLL